MLRRRGDLRVTETRARVRLRERGRRPVQRRGRAPPSCCPSTRTAPRGGSAPTCAADSASTVGVVISDTFGRSWRRGVTDVAIGCAGVAGVVDLRGTLDAMGRVLEATEVCVVDELAAAADVVMGKASGMPAVVVRGAPAAWLREGNVRRARSSGPTTRTSSASVARAGAPPTRPPRSRRVTSARAPSRATERARSFAATRTAGVARRAAGHRGPGPSRPVTSRTASITSALLEPTPVPRLHTSAACSPGRRRRARAPSRGPPRGRSRGCTCRRASRSRRRTGRGRRARPPRPRARGGSGATRDGGARAGPRWRQRR